jgi:hypothetical protein
MDDGVRMSSSEFRWSTFWMGDVMSFRLEKNHGAADAIDYNQVGVFTNSGIWCKLIPIKGNSRILFNLCTLQNISKITYDE